MYTANKHNPQHSSAPKSNSFQISLDNIRTPHLMFLKNPHKTLKTFISSPTPLFNPESHRPKTPLCCFTQANTYVNVYMQWKKDSYYDNIDHIHRSSQLKPIISMKNIIVNAPNCCIPISDVSKRGLQLGLNIKVARFLRLYPSMFQEFTGPPNNLPWFKLTEEAEKVEREERRVLGECKVELQERLKKFILMSKEKALPLKIIHGMSWYLGLPEDFLHHPSENLDGCFSFVELENGVKGLKVEVTERPLSVLQRNAIKRGVYSGKSMEPIEFPLFPSKGLRLKTKIKDWLEEFQKVPYVSPYEEFSHLDPTSDVAEKRVVGFLHELLCLFVEHSAERKKLLCLKKYFGLPQKMHKAFERHPHIFYLSSRNTARTAILKEAYKDELGMKRHPMLTIRLQYIELVKQSEMILKRKRFAGRRNQEIDLNCGDENMRETALSGESDLADENTTESRCWVSSSEAATNT